MDLYFCKQTFRLKTIVVRSAGSYAVVCHTQAFPFKNEAFKSVCSLRWNGSQSYVIADWSQGSSGMQGFFPPGLLVRFQASTVPPLPAEFRKIEGEREIRSSTTALSHYSWRRPFVWCRARTQVLAHGKVYALPSELSPKHNMQYFQSTTGNMDLSPFTCS